MKRTAALASFVALLVASTASAVTYDVKLLFDTDRKASTGCTFSTPAGTFAGAEVMVTTHVNVTGGVATTTGVIAQGCVPGTGVLFGDPVPLDSRSWPAGLTSSGNLFVETHVPPSTLGMTSSITPMRMAFVVTGGTLTDAVMSSQAGTSIVYPEPGRRRVVSPTGDGAPRTIILDGSDSDWNGILPIATGGASSPDLRILNGYAFGTPSDLFFAVRLQANPSAPTARNDSYSIPAAGGTLNVPAGSAVLSNDRYP